MGVGEESKKCCICGLELRPDADRCPRCGNVIHQKHDGA
ncbi:MAG TPA: transposase [Thermoplasmata archaeon]|nr:transposase [Thermoplasmata archaeon]